MQLKCLKILKEGSYRQTVEEVHQNNHDQEHKGEEEDVAEGRVEGDVRELELSNEHGEGLDQGEPDYSFPKLMVPNFHLMPLLEAL